MGYTTDFTGRFELDKPLSVNTKKFLDKLNETRRMSRNIKGYGVEGEFFVNGGGSMGQDREDNIINYNSPPITQPGLWCQWKPNDEGTAIEWDGGEKFYNYVEWLVYLIHKVLKPNGYKLTGTVVWQGEETGDVGEIVVKNNKVTVIPFKEKRMVVNPENCAKNDFVNGKWQQLVDYMETNQVLYLDKKPKK